MSNTKEITITWSSEDIEMIARINKTPLDDERIGMVLDLIKLSYQPSRGIDWGTVESAIQLVNKQSKVKVALS